MSSIIDIPKHDSTNTYPIVNSNITLRFATLVSIGGAGINYIAWFAVSVSIRSVSLVVASK